MNKIIPFSQLSRANLIVDAIYEGGTAGTLGDEPLSKIMHCGNRGGFRKVGTQYPKYVILYSTLAEKDWPDYLDSATGIYTYYGDNKKPGHELHDTSFGGNKLLKDIFQSIHANHRVGIPPFFIFSKYPTKSSRSVRFRGLAAPGADGMTSIDDLVAVWKSKEGQRFQNYRAIFTILDIAEVSRNWLDDLYSGNTFSKTCPDVWQIWISEGRYTPLKAQPTINFRSIEEQTTKTKLEKEILSDIFEYFQEDSYAFESFSAAIVALFDPNFFVDEITRRSVDGGRDAIGRYRMGPLSDPIFMEFALEAKCYNPGLNGGKVNSVGVKDTSRLISRLRHRQFGILVTTSVISRQAYKEIRDDQHPVIILCGRDISSLLIEKGFNSKEIVLKWLSDDFPIQK